MVKMNQNNDLATVSVVMATYNRAYFIAQAIDSLLGQSHPPDEFIIVNDGSTDDTRDIIKQYGERICYFEKANAGKSAALNMALPHVTSTFVWLFDDDDIAFPYALKTHTDYLSEHPECDFTYSSNYWFSGDTFRCIAECSGPRTIPPQGEYFIWAMESEGIPTSMPSMLIRTECYRSVGQFDEELPRSMDRDMVLRIARRFRAGRIETPTFAIRRHDGPRGPASQRHAEAERHRVWDKHKPRVFGRLRASLALWEYLPDKNSACELTEVERREALLRRAIIMTVHGMLEEATVDFSEYAKNLGASKPSSTERKLIIMLLRIHEHQKRKIPATFYVGLGRLSRGQKALLTTQIRGIYWNLLRNLRQNRFSIMLRTINRGMSLMAGSCMIPATRNRRSSHKY